MRFACRTLAVAFAAGARLGLSPQTRAAMIGPTQLSEHVPALYPGEATERVADARINRPSCSATRLGRFGEEARALAPSLVMNTSLRMVPGQTRLRDCGLATSTRGL